MGIQEDYAKARALAKQGKYQEARRLIIEYDNPKTDALLNKLNKAILANKQAMKAKRGNKPLQDTKQTLFSGCMRRIRFAVVSVFAVCGLLFALSYLLPPLDETADNQDVIVEVARIEWTATSTENHINTPTATPTDIPIPTNTPLWIPTITNTPAPTGTALPTSIPLPTSSPIPTTYYIINESAFVRDCPRTTCNRITSLFLGDVIETIDTNVQGEDVLSGTRWMKGIVYGQIVYIHSSLVSTIQPAPIVQQSSSGSVRSINTTSSQSQNSCSIDYNCGDFSTCSQVQSYFRSCPGDPSNLDGDGDGVPCESMCR